MTRKQTQHSPEEIAEIRRRYANGDSPPHIALDLGVPRTVVLYYARHATTLAQRHAYYENGKRRCKSCGAIGHYAKTCKATDAATFARARVSP